jgi:hypothetical protein
MMKKCNIFQFCGLDYGKRKTYYANSGGKARQPRGRYPRPRSRDQPAGVWSLWADGGRDCDY